MPNSSTGPAPVPPPAAGYGGPAAAPRGRPADQGDRAARTRWFTPYVRLFAPPGTRAFALAGLLARLPMGMLSISAVIMIATTRGSYALAGAVTATGLVATALLAPLVARLVDRHGQARIAVPAVCLSAAASLTLLLCVRHDAPDWTLFAAYAAGSTAPNTGGMARARWAHLYRGSSPEAEAARHTANSFEQALDELCFMLGPVLATFLCVSLFPEAGTLTATVLLLGGTLLFAAQRRTEPPVAPHDGPARATALLRTPGLPRLLAAFLATGAVFGALEVVTVAYADGLGHKGAAGAVLALQALGSGAAGLAFGALRPGGSAGRRFAVCVGAMAALMTLPLLASTAGSLLVLAPALLVAGMATAPAMVTGMTLVQRLTPPGRLNEGMTLAVTALLGGIAAGSAAGGWAAEHLGGSWGYAVPPVAAALAAAVAAAVALTTAAATGAPGPRARTSGRRRRATVR
ncbi:MFS transporter [Streptomyces radiopugnans]|uniref:Major Facilitator Superfamily protein n=1 Tax=Streptomyces radiopugnans TaxID=403935 RepID=A0A1H8YTW6_9ACTN|nr:MFS transporter [Streptomyces radiopugnans]SEP55645.1 Major Facilitator Superfamily protein [Streptomyces radiopugnans]